VSAISRIGGPADDLTSQPSTGGAAWSRLAGLWSALDTGEQGAGAPLGTLGTLGAQDTLGLPGTLGAGAGLTSLSRGALPPAQARASAFSEALQAAALRTAPTAGRARGGMRLLSAGAAGMAARSLGTSGAGASMTAGRLAFGAAGSGGRGASGPIQAIDQTAVSEYGSAAQARLWGGSTCSAASLTAVLRSRGLDVKIADVLKAMPGGLTVAQGLVSRPALVGAAARFGVQAQDNVTSYDALQQATAAGQPVLVDVTNGKFPEGHWLVVTGADSRGVSIVDSSGYHLTTMSRDEFQAAWSKRGIRILGGPRSAAVAGGH
jgi:hypothetical protein